MPQRSLRAALSEPRAYSKRVLAYFTALSVATGVLFGLAQLQSGPAGVPIARRR